MSEDAMGPKYSGADWLIGNYVKVEDLSVLGHDVADILGQVFRGLYHLPTGCLRKASWTDAWNVRITLPDALSTYDFNALTCLVVLCHDRCIRLEITPCNSGYLRLSFSARRRDGDSISNRHPTMEAAIADCRKKFGLGLV